MKLEQPTRGGGLEASRRHCLEATFNLDGALLRANEHAAQRLALFTIAAPCSCSPYPYEGLATAP